MLTAQELLEANRIKLPHHKLGKQSSICPECSHTRTKAHQNTECLSVKIDARGATWHCNHCGWSGPEKGKGKANGHARDHFEATYDYADKDGIIRFRKVRAPGNNVWLQRP